MESEPMARIGKIIIADQSAPVLYDDQEDQLLLASVNERGFKLLSTAVEGPIHGVLEKNPSTRMNIKVLSATVNLFSAIVACRAEAEVLIPLAV